MFGLLHYNLKLAFMCSIVLRFIYLFVDFFFVYTSIAFQIFLFVFFIFNKAYMIFQLKFYLLNGNLFLRRSMKSGMWLFIKENMIGRG